MKRNIFTLFLFAFALLTTNSIEAQKFADLDVSPMDVASHPADYREANKLIKIEYSRPQLKGRSLDKLTPNGKVWRTGANEAAQITLYVDMKWGGTTIKAGTYTFYTIPGENEWTAIISTDLNVWGSYFYNKANDVARITVPAKTSDNSLEAFSIAFDDGDSGVNMHLGWGNVRVTIPFTK